MRSMSTKAHPITEVLYEYLRTEISDFEPYDFNELKQHRDLYDRYVNEHRKRLVAQWNSVLKLFFMDSFKPILNYTNATPFTNDEKDTIITLMIIYSNNHPALKFLKKVLSRHTYKDREYHAFIKDYLQVNPKILNEDLDDVIFRYPGAYHDFLELNYYNNTSKRTTFNDIFPDFPVLNSKKTYDGKKLLEIGRISLNQLTALIEKRIDSLTNITPESLGSLQGGKTREEKIIDLFLPIVKDQLYIKRNLVYHKLQHEAYEIIW